MTKKQKNLNNILSDTDLSEIIQMALSDHVMFSEIQLQYGLKEDQVKDLMDRKSVKPPEGWSDSDNKSGTKSGKTNFWSSLSSSISAKRRPLFAP